MGGQTYGAALAEATAPPLPYARRVLSSSGASAVQLRGSIGLPPSHTRAANHRPRTAAQDPACRQEAQVARSGCVNVSCPAKSASYDDQQAGIGHLLQIRGSTKAIWHTLCF